MSKKIDRPIFGRSAAIPERSTTWGPNYSKCPKTQRLVWENERKMVRLSAFSDFECLGPKFIAEMFWLPNQLFSGHPKTELSCSVWA